MDPRSDITARCDTSIIANPPFWIPDLRPQNRRPLGHSSLPLQGCFFYQPHPRRAFPIMTDSRLPTPDMCTACQSRFTHPPSSHIQRRGVRSLAKKLWRRTPVNDTLQGTNLRKGPDNELFHRPQAPDYQKAGGHRESRHPGRNPLLQQREDHSACRRDGNGRP